MDEAKLCFGVKRTGYNYMFSRNQRVSRKLFVETLKSGKRLSSPFFSLVGKKILDGKTPPRFAVVVSKKISKSAVIRNRCKRRIYHAIRAVIKGKERNLSGGIYLFFLKTAVKDADFEKITNEVNNILPINFFRPRTTVFQKIQTSN